MGSRDRLSKEYGRVRFSVPPVWGAPRVPGLAPRSPAPVRPSPGVSYSQVAVAGSTPSDLAPASMTSLSQAAKPGARLS